MIENLVVPLLDIYLRGLKTYAHSKTCVVMLKKALFVIVKNWKQYRYNSMNERLYSGNPYHRTLFNNKGDWLLTHVTTWNSTQSCLVKRSKITYYMVPFTQYMLLKMTKLYKLRTG